MGLFDKLFNAPETPKIPYKPRFEQEAYVAIIVASVMADGEMSDVESENMATLLVFKTFFNGFDLAGLIRGAFQAQKEYGSKTVIDNSAGLVSEELKPTLFVMAIELLLADGKLGSSEKEIAEYLANALKLDPEMSGKIVEVMLIRNKGNAIIND